MNKHSRTILTLFIVTGIYSLSSAGKIKVNVSADMQKNSNPPLSYFVYEKPTKKDIVDNSVKLFDNLNRFSGARMDLHILDNANNSNGIKIHKDGVLFDVYNPSAMGFLYTKSLEKYCSPPTDSKNNSRLLDKKSATIAAKKYLEKLDLLPPSIDEMYLEEVNTICGGSSENPEEIFELLRVVRFGRKLNGLKVVGATRIILRLANDGELVTIIKDWPKLIRKEVKNSMKIHQKNEWEQIIKKHLENQYGESEVGSSDIAIDVENVDLVMYDDGEGFVEPALFAKGKKLTKNGKKYPYDWMIPVLADSKAKYKGMGLGSKDDRDAEEYPSADE